MKKKEKQSKKIKGWKVIFLKKIVKLDSEKGRMINGESWGVFQLLWIVILMNFIIVLKLFWNYLTLCISFCFNFLPCSLTPSPITTSQKTLWLIQCSQGFLVEIRFLIKPMVQLSCWRSMSEIVKSLNTWVRKEATLSMHLFLETWGKKRPCLHFYFFEPNFIGFHFFCLCRSDCLRTNKYLCLWLFDAFHLFHVLHIYSEGFAFILC